MRYTLFLLIIVSSLSSKVFLSTLRLFLFSRSPEHVLLKQEAVVFSGITSKFQGNHFAIKKNNLKTPIVNDGRELSAQAVNRLGQSAPPAVLQRLWFISNSTEVLTTAITTEPSDS